jgi:DinB superfamily
MTDNQGFIADNRRERERLRALVARLSDADLARPLNEQWNVAATLAHMAFWDWRALTLVDRFAEGSFTLPPENDIDVDATNQAAFRLAEALPLREMARLALAAAEAVDGRLEAASPALLDALPEEDCPVNPWRSEHRAEHLDEIERLLAQ